MTEPTTAPQAAPQPAPSASPASPNLEAPGIPPSRLQAVRTRRATHPRVQLLTPPGARPTGLTPEVRPATVPPDDRFGPAGKVRLLVAYDAGQPPPPLPPGTPGHELQQLGVADTVTAVLDRLTDQLVLRGVGRGVVRRRVERVIGWLAGFDGDTWEQRWIASGADAAPRGWVEAAFPEHAKKWQRYAAVGGVYHLVQARVLRPSYAWLLLCRAGNALTRFLETNAANHMAGLRALPAYQQALPRHRADAEHCLARVMIRTGKLLDALTGDELLHYADIVRTSGRHRREHLAWELLGRVLQVGAQP